MKKLYGVVAVVSVLVLALSGCTAKKIEEKPIVTKKGIEGKLQSEGIKYLDYRENPDLYIEGEDSVTFMTENYDEATLKSINKIFSDVKDKNIGLAVAAENTTDFFSNKYPNNPEKVDEVLSQFFDYLSLDAVDAGGAVVTGNLDVPGESFVFTYRLVENFKVKGLEKIANQKLLNEIPGTLSFNARVSPEGVTELKDDSSFNMLLGTADSLVDEETRNCIIETGFNFWFYTKEMKGAEVSIYVQNSSVATPGVYVKNIPEAAKAQLNESNNCGAYSQFL